MTNWPVPRFAYADYVYIKPLENVPARVMDLHFYGSTGSVEYDVRYFHDGKEYKVRVFEDELSAGTLQDESYFREKSAKAVRALEEHDPLARHIASMKP